LLLARLERARLFLFGFLGKLDFVARKERMLHIVGACCSTVVSALFLIGSAYFVAGMSWALEHPNFLLYDVGVLVCVLGSYPHANRFYYVTDSGQKMESRAPPGHASVVPGQDAAPDARKRRVSFDLETGRPKSGAATNKPEFRQVSSDAVNPLHGETKTGVDDNNAAHIADAAHKPVREAKKKKRPEKKDIGRAKMMMSTTPTGLFTGSVSPTASASVPHAPIPSADEEDYRDEEEEL
jgi:hypothetical protein